MIARMGAAHDGDAHWVVVQGTEHALLPGHPRRAARPIASVLPKATAKTSPPTGDGMAR